MSNAENNDSPPELLTLKDVKLKAVKALVEGTKVSIIDNPGYPVIKNVGQHTITHMEAHLMDAGTIKKARKGKQFRFSVKFGKSTVASIPFYNLKSKNYDPAALLNMVDKKLLQFTDAVKVMKPRSKPRSDSEDKDDVFMLGSGSEDGNDSGASDSDSDDKDMHLNNMLKGVDSELKQCKTLFSLLKDADTKYPQITELYKEVAVTNAQKTAELKASLRDAVKTQELILMQMHVLYSGKGTGFDDVWQRAVATSIMQVDVADKNATDIDDNNDVDNNDDVDNNTDSNKMEIVAKKPTVQAS